MCIDVLFPVVSLEISSVIKVEQYKLLELKEFQYKEKTFDIIEPWARGSLQEIIKENPNKGFKVHD